MVENSQNENKINKEEIELIKKSTLTYMDFPKKGILFFDIFSILGNPSLSSMLYNNSASMIRNYLKENNIKLDLIAGLESRGFLIGSVLASMLNVGFIPIRKQNEKNSKLPGKIISEDYGTEYSKDSFDLQLEHVKKCNRVFIIDDLIATGGSLVAASNLIHKAEAEVVGIFCVFELVGLKGRDKQKIGKEKMLSLIQLED